MSTTPSTSDAPYTIVGGSRVQHTGPGVRGLSIVVLDRGSRTMRTELFEKLVAVGADEIIAIVGPAPHYDVEQLASRFPTCRFVLLTSATTPGEQVNIGVHESVSPLVFVIWSDQDLPRISDRTFERLREIESVCTVPSIRNDRGLFVPSITAPAFHRNLFRTIPTQPGKHLDESLFPFDYVGVYRREEFKSVGGFDPFIANPYWQKMDFGLRSYLWGERIAVLSELRVDCSRPLPEDDTTPDMSYSRFHLKNLAIRFVGDSGKLPARRAVRFLFRSGLGPLSALRVFREVRSWIRQNRYRFVQDARRVTELWEVSQ